MAERGLEDRVLEEALARAGEGAFAVGADGRIVMWNPAAQKIMGYSARDAVGRPSCRVFVGGEDGGRRLCYQGCHGIAPVRVAETLQIFDVDTRTKAGKPIWLHVNALAIPSRNGRGWLTVHLLHEVTTLKELLRLLEQRLSAHAPRLGEASMLTRREREILRLLASGVNTKVAAERLHVSRATVRNHVQNILEKLGVHSRLEAVAYANRNSLI